MRTTAEIAAWREKNPYETLPLRWAELNGASLSEANLSGADLSGADLSGADLRWANLSRANLSGANLSWANLNGVNLSEANLSWANLNGVNLNGTRLNGANLNGTRLPHFQIPDGDLIVWGKKHDVLVKMLVPTDARRTASLVGRKCRAEYVQVLEIENGLEFVQVKNRHGTNVYRVGEITRPDSYDDDIRVECTHGVHFYLTKAEAEEWM